MALPQTLIEGKYEILSKIKEGGMGTIYKVRHRLLDEIRVVKVMRPHVGSDEELRQRFTQEAKTATRLKHPNIGAILDFALDPDGTAYIVMEFIDGINLRELLMSSGPPGLPLSLEIAHQTLLALAYLHRKNIVHRDVAPDNLMLTHDEEERAQVKLIDLGIAKTLDKTIELTSTGVFLGKVKYSSPEQLAGLPADETLDGRSDLYSLGVVLYELLTGRRPFLGETPRELFAAHLFQKPIAFSETDPEGQVPAEIRELVLKALEKNREHRFSTAEEFDREIITLASRYAGPYDSQSTQWILLRARTAPAIRVDAVTPSAQDRLDRQFRAGSTPPQSPFSGGELSAPSPGPTDADKTVTDPRRKFGPGRAQKTVPMGRASRRMTLYAVPLLLAVAAGTVLLLFLPPRQTSPRGTGKESTEAVRPRAAQEIPARAEPPTVAPTAAPSPFAQKEAAEEEAHLRASAEQARLRAEAARRQAQRAGAQETVPGLYDHGRAKEREGQRLLDKGDFAQAQEAFQEGTEIYLKGEEWARRSPKRETASAAKTGALPEATPRSEVARIAAVPAPRPAPEPPKAAAAPPTGLPRAAPSEEERVRETIRAYVKAQNTLDVDLYARVYPALTGELRRVVESAFRDLKSQQLEFEIRRIDISNSEAIVRGLERRLAIPRVGSEQRDSRERVIRLEKRADAWVIQSLQ